MLNEETVSRECDQQGTEDIKMEIWEEVEFANQKFPEAFLRGVSEK